MSKDFPDVPPSQGWPATHARRLDSLERSHASLERSLPIRIFAACLLGTALQPYVQPEQLERAKELLAQYPHAGPIVALFLLLGGAKIPPPADPRLRFLWELWARWAPSQWDRWGGLKMPGHIEPPLPPPPAAEPPPAAPGLPPTLRPGDLPSPEEDPRGHSTRDGGSP